MIIYLSIEIVISINIHELPSEHWIFQIMKHSNFILLSNSIMREWICWLTELITKRLDKTYGNLVSFFNFVIKNQWKQYIEHMLFFFLQFSNQKAIWKKQDLKTKKRKTKENRVDLTQLIE